MHCLTHSLPPPPPLDVPPSRCQAPDADGSGLADGSWRGAVASGDKPDGVAGEVWPSGELSWHDTHSGFGAEPEEERQARFGDGDFWDD